MKTQVLLWVQFWVFGVLGLPNGVVKRSIVLQDKEESDYICWKNARGSSSSAPERAENCSQLLTPDPSDCSKFTICLQSGPGGGPGSYKKYSCTCEDPLKFSRSKLQCSSEASKCPQKNEDEIHLKDLLKNRGGKLKGRGVRDEGKDGLCQYSGRFPTGDCDEFVQCVTGPEGTMEAFVHQCPEGKEYSKVYRLCVHPAMAKCSVKAKGLKINAGSNSLYQVQGSSGGQSTTGRLQVTSTTPGMTSERPEMTSKRTPEYMAATSLRPQMILMTSGLTSKRPEVTPQYTPVTPARPQMTLMTSPMATRGSQLTPEPLQITSKRPEMDIQYSSRTSERPQVTLRTSPVTSTRPPMTSKRPQVTLQYSRMTSDSPLGTFRSSQMTSQRPQVTTKYPRMSTGRPQVTQGSSQVTSTRPPMTSHMTPQITSPRPSVTLPYSKMTSETPPVTTKTSQMTSKRPQMTSQKPQETPQYTKMTSKTTQVTLQYPKMTSEKPLLTPKPSQTTSKTAETTPKTLLVTTSGPLYTKGTDPEGPPLETEARIVALNHEQAFSAPKVYNLPPFLPPKNAGKNPQKPLAQPEEIHGRTFDSDEDENASNRYPSEPSYLEKIPYDNLQDETGEKVSYVNEDPPEHPDEKDVDYEPSDLKPDYEFPDWNAHNIQSHSDGIDYIFEYEPQLDHINKEMELDEVEQQLHAKEEEHQTNRFTHPTAATVPLQENYYPEENQRESVDVAQWARREEAADAMKALPVEQREEFTQAVPSQQTERTIKPESNHTEGSSFTTPLYLIGDLAAEEYKQTRIIEQEAPVYGRQELPTFNEEDQAAYKEEDQPVYEKDSSVYNNEDPPVYREQEDPAVYNEENRPGYIEEDPSSSVYKKEEPPVYKEEDQAVYNEEDRLVYKEEDQPTYKEEDRPVHYEENPPVYKEEDPPVHIEEAPPVYLEEDRPVYKEQPLPVYKKEDRPVHLEEDPPAHNEEDRPHYTEQELPAHNHEED